MMRASSFCKKNKRERITPCSGIVTHQSVADDGGGRIQVYDPFAKWSRGRGADSRKGCG